MAPPTPKATATATANVPPPQTAGKTTPATKATAQGATVADGDLALNPPAAGSAAPAASGAVPAAPTPPATAPSNSQPAESSSALPNEYIFRLAYDISNIGPKDAYLFSFGKTPTGEFPAGKFGDVQGFHASFAALWDLNNGEKFRFRLGGEV